MTELETIIANLKRAIACGELTQDEAADLMSDIQDHALEAKLEAMTLPELIAVAYCEAV